MCLGYCVTYVTGVQTAISLSPSGAIQPPRLRSACSKVQSIEAKRPLHEVFLQNFQPPNVLVRYSITNSSSPAVADIPLLTMRATRVLASPAVRGGAASTTASG